MYDELDRSLFEIVTFFLRPRQDKRLLDRAGITLETALFPLLARVARRGPLGIGELAGEVDRDYSTVSRQVDKLIERGLLETAPDPSDKRVRKVGLTETGKSAAARLAETRRVMMREALRDWDETQLNQLRESLAHLALTIRRYAEYGDEADS